MTSNPRPGVRASDIEARNEAGYFLDELDRLQHDLGLADDATMAHTRQAMTAMTRLADIQDTTGLADDATLAEVRDVLHTIRADIDANTIAMSPATHSDGVAGQRHTVVGELVAAPRPTGRGGRWEVWVATDDPAHADVVRVIHPPAPAIQTLLADSVGRQVAVTAPPETTHRGVIHAESIGAVRTPDHTLQAPSPSASPGLPAAMQRAILEHYVRPVAQVMAGVRAPSSMTSLMSPTMAKRFRVLARPLGRGSAPQLRQAYIQIGSPRIDVSAAITIAGTTHPLALGLASTSGRLRIDTLTWPTLKLRTPGMHTRVKGPLQTGFVAGQSPTSGHRPNR